MDLSAMESVFDCLDSYMFFVDTLKYLYLLFSLHLKSRFSRLMDTNRPGDAITARSSVGTAGLSVAVPVALREGCHGADGCHPNH